MRRSASTVAAILLASLCGGAYAAEADMAATLATLHAQEADALAHGQWRFLERYYDPGYTEVAPDGRTTSRAQILRETQAVIAAGRLRPLTYDIHAMRVDRDGQDWLVLLDETGDFVLSAAGDPARASRFQANVVQTERWRRTPSGPRLMQTTVQYADFANHYAAATRALSQPAEALPPPPAAPVLAPDAAQAMQRLQSEAQARAAAQAQSELIARSRQLQENADALINASKKRMEENNQVQNCLLHIGSGCGD